MDIETIHLTNNLLIIVGTDRGRFPMSHSFLVTDEVSALIDTGCGIELLKKIKKTYSIDIIINSHCHPDHSAGNWIFESTPVHAPIMGQDSHGRLDPLSIRLFPDTRLAERWRGWITRTMGFQDKEPEGYFDYGHVFDFGKLKLQAVHTPGHTKDHFCFFEPTSGILLTFDIDFTPFGPWYGHTESNLADFRKSLSMVVDLKPKVVASSHNWPIYENIDKSIDNYLWTIEQRSEAIMEMLRKGATKPDLVKAAPIYGYHPYEPEILSSFESRMIDLHIEEMLKSGALSKDGDKLVCT